MKNWNDTGLTLSIFIGLLFVSCNKEPQAIDYGKDPCFSCQMTIVDKIYGAEIITDKGKVYKFDAAECLIRFKNELTESKVGYQFVTNYVEEPEKFIPMNEAKYLISENLPSPMGAFLTAFKTEKHILEMQQEVGGKIFTWNELEQYFKEKK